MQYVRLVTGTSSGLGAAIALAALQAGHAVIETARDIESAAEAQPEIGAKGGVWRQLDVTWPDVREQVASIVIEHNVNVVVNNAGYALRGAMEDFKEQDIFDQFNTNLFGAFRVIQGAIPAFRSRKSGTLVNISSTSGMTGFAGFSVYAATKFAIEGASEGLASELAPFNIRVLVVQPGAFRTSFQNAGVSVPLSQNYVGTTVDDVLQRVVGIGGKEPGNPALGAKAIVDVVVGAEAGRAADGLLRLPLGEDALARAQAKIDDFSSNVDKVKHISSSVTFPKNA